MESSDEPHFVGAFDGTLEKSLSNTEDLGGDSFDFTKWMRHDGEPQEEAGVDGSSNFFATRFLKEDSGSVDRSTGSPSFFPFAAAEEEGDAACFFPGAIQSHGEPPEDHTVSEEAPKKTCENEEDHSMVMETASEKILVQEENEKEVEFKAQAPIVSTQPLPTLPPASASNPRTAPAELMGPPPSSLITAKKNTTVALQHSPVEPPDSIRLIPSLPAPIEASPSSNRCVEAANPEPKQTAPLETMPFSCAPLPSAPTAVAPLPPPASTSTTSVETQPYSTRRIAEDPLVNEAQKLVEQLEAAPLSLRRSSDSHPFAVQVEKLLKRAAGASGDALNGLAAVLDTLTSLLLEIMSKAPADIIESLSDKTNEDGEETSELFFRLIPKLEERLRQLLREEEDGTVEQAVLEKKNGNEEANEGEVELDATLLAYQYWLRDNPSEKARLMSFSQDTSEPIDS